ncbi:IRF3 factor, partial [Amia calva]|nr:IRF3 factor [Amia calva]
MGSHKPLLLPWLREQLDSGQFPGVYWTNREQEEFCIPWKHGLRHDSSPHDTLIFKAWAEVSGLFRKGVTQPDPSVWKRNFRCALKSKGVIPLADHSNDSANPHRLFRLPSEREKDTAVHTHTYWTLLYTPTLPRDYCILRLYSFVCFSLWIRFPKESGVLFFKPVTRGVDLASKFPRSQSNRASVGCAGQTSPIHGGPTSQLTGLKGSAVNVLVPDTTAHLQRCSGVHASTVCVEFPSSPASGERETSPPGKVSRCDWKSSLAPRLAKKSSPRMQASWIGASQNLCRSRRPPTSISSCLLPSICVVSPVTILKLSKVVPQVASEVVRVPGRSKEMVEPESTKPQQSCPSIKQGRGMSAEEQQLEGYKQGMSSAVINDTLSTQFRVSIYFRGTKIKECLASDPRGFLLVWEGPVGLGAVVGEEGAAAVMDPSVLPLVTLPGSDSLLDRTQAKLTHRLLKKLGAGLEVRVKGQGVWATRRGDTWAYWSLSQHDRSCRPKEVPKEGQKVYSMGEFTKGMIDFMEKETGSPATSLWFCLGEKWPDPENRPWEKKLIMVEVTLTSLEILHQLAVQQGASSLHSEEVELQVSDNPSLLNYLLQSLDSMDTS